ncbi:MAG: DUF1697 domain-containing protein [Acidimicrobiia bacterium]|nr:DUF1697 domain-containing protein [Acidimicrobiia bacterium]
MADHNRYVILLRAINVGGHNKVPMADLRSALTAATFSDVSTYIQSGNVVADAGHRDEAAVVADVETVMIKRFGLSVPVVARPVGEWEAILNANPFPDAVSEPKLLHVSLCDAAPTPASLAAIDLSAFVPDRLAVVGRHLYLWYPNGSARSKLTGALLEQRLGVTTTARNWSTMVALARMIGG